MKKYRVSRFRQLIWPQELYIDKYHVLTRKRHFPAFWRVSEESIPLSKLASIIIDRGMVFSKLTIENSGGPFPIIVNGLWNKQASEARFILEKIEQEMQQIRNPEILGLIGEDDDSGDDGIDPEVDPKTPPESGAQKFEKVKTTVSTIASKVKATANSAREKLTERVLPVDEIVDNVYNDTPPVNYDDNWDFIEDEPEADVPNIVAYNREHPASEDNTQTCEEYDLVFDDCLSEKAVDEEPVWKVGNIDKDWTPPAPWEPRKVETPHSRDEIEEIREIDPIDFLNETTTETRAPRINKPDNSRKASGGFNIDISDKVEGLTNWWNNTREELASVAPSSRRNRRKLK